VLEGAGGGVGGGGSGVPPLDEPPPHEEVKRIMTKNSEIEGRVYRQRLTQNRSITLSPQGVEHQTSAGMEVSIREGATGSETKN
jgi:hypothetical protein